MLFLVLQTALLLLAAYLLGVYCGSLLFRFYSSDRQPADAVKSDVAFSEQPFIELETGPAPPAPNLAVVNRFERALLGTRPRERQAPRLDRAADVSQAMDPASGSRPVSEAQELAASSRSVHVKAIQGSETAEASTAWRAAETSEPAGDPVGDEKLLEAGRTEGSAETIKAASKGTEEVEASSILEAGEAFEPAVANDPIAPDLSTESTDVSDAFETVEAADPSETIETAATRAMMKQPGSVQPGTAEPMQASSDHASLAPTLPVASSTGGITGTSAPLVVSAQQSADDLTRICAIDDATAAQLAELGVNSYARLAAFTRADVDRIGATIERARIWREGWIEQAQLLANGRETAYARKIAGNSDTLVPFPHSCNEAAAGAAPEPSRKEADTHDAGPASEAGLIAEPTPAAVAEAEAGLEMTVPLAADGVGDDLTRIRGIDASASAILRANGVTTFRHIADMRTSELRELEALLDLPGQSRRHNWQKQARKLIKRGVAGTLPQRQEAPEIVADDDLDDARRGDVASTIVAPAGLGEETGAGLQIAADADKATKERGGLSAIDAVLGDDLKRIRGIGTLIENRLNTLGICRYQQIANWTAAEIDRISQELDFQGRIEREAWVEQARILVSGGRTEFSDRVDRR